MKLEIDGKIYHGIISETNRLFVMSEFSETGIEESLNDETRKSFEDWNKNILFKEIKFRFKNGKEGILSGCNPIGQKFYDNPFVEFHFITMEVAKVTWKSWPHHLTKEPIHEEFIVDPSKVIKREPLMIREDREFPSSTNYMHVVENSQSFDKLEQILFHAKTYTKDSFLIIALENTIKNGYKLIKDVDEKLISENWAEYFKKHPEMMPKNVNGYVIKFNEVDSTGCLYKKETYDPAFFEDMKKQGMIEGYEIDDIGVKVTLKEK